MTIGCLSQSLGGELLKMLLLIFNLSGIRREFVCTLIHIKHYEDSGFVLSFFPRVFVTWPWHWSYNHTVSAALPWTSTEKRSPRSDDEPLLVGVYCSGSLSLILPFPPLFLSIFSSLRGLGEQADPDLELIPMTSCLTLGKTLSKPQCLYL